MKYFYSYYPTKITSDDEILFNLLSIKLSSSLVNKKNKKVGIYCDKKTIELLKEYEIELDFYENIENEIKNTSSEKLFAVCKLYSNSIQTEPFVQLDTDLFLFDNFNFKLLESSDISFFTIEQIDSFSPKKYYDGWLDTYLNSFNDLKEKFPSLIYKEYMNPFVAYNCALVGGTNYKIFSEIYTPILDLLNSNKTYLENLGKHPMAVLEQYIITGHLKKIGYDVTDINFISNDRIPYIYDDGNSLLFRISNHDDIILSNSKNSIESTHKNTLNSLIRHKFNGTLHLQGAKGNIDIKQYIYSMLQYYEPRYISWLENKIGKKYEFQKISISKNILI
jgi:hypothetical protein